ncbi:DNA double-strand break repair nuclease NurA [Persephonella atlantica]|uniref:DNA double-strand break repair nuclease NurA n=1 Tax=Persephonella atlantica TaxID=2699429 RepID=A0ABS1GIU1_9AQUI|nr:DNA double-strand break repair nuclease NurA [Persephonella atlantica]MBK3332736.1 DNA double-strand break repair nuclease NurA [Persephonella atlantica]
MRPELLKKTYSLKSELSQLAFSLNEEIKREEVLSKWKNYVPAPVDRFAVAADGSFNKKHYLGFYLYSVSGYAVGLKNGSTPAEEVTGDINLSVIKKTELIDQYLRMLMFLCEMKALIKLAEREKPKVLLIDGTLSSRFITVFPKTDWFCSEEFEGKIASIAGEFIPAVKDMLLEEDIVAFSKEIKEKVTAKLFKEFGEKGLRRDIVEATLSKLAYFEYLLLLHKLFYGLEFKPVVIGVAKTSHSTDIFKKSIPDIRVLHQFVKDNGYTLPQTYVNLDEIKWEFSQIFEYIEENIAYQLRDVSIRYFYGKYDRGRTISLIEYYENPDLEGITPEYVLDILSNFSVSGYPFPLRKADYEVRITRRDMEMIENLLGLQNEIHGREGLE